EIHHHGDFISMRGQHQAGRTAFVQHRNAIAIGIREGGVREFGNVVEPDPLAAGFMADGTGSVDQGFEKIERFIAHRAIMPERGSNVQSRTQALESERELCLEAGAIRVQDETTALLRAEEHAGPVISGPEERVATEQKDPAGRSLTDFAILRSVLEGIGFEIGVSLDIAEPECGAAKNADSFRVNHGASRILEFESVGKL